MGVRIRHFTVFHKSIIMPNKLNVQFTARQSELLENMAEEMGTTKAGVVKTALVLLELAIREQKEGNALGVIKGEKVLKEIVNIH
jgi:hypothetical protein